MLLRIGPTDKREVVADHRSRRTYLHLRVEKKRIGVCTLAGHEMKVFASFLLSKPSSTNDVIVVHPTKTILRDKNDQRVEQTTEFYLQRQTCRASYPNNRNAHQHHEMHWHDRRSSRSRSLVAPRRNTPSFPIKCSVYCTVLRRYSSSGKSTLRRPMRMIFANRSLFTNSCSNAFPDSPVYPVTKAVFPVVICKLCEDYTRMSDTHLALRVMIIYVVWCTLACTIVDNEQRNSDESQETHIRASFSSS